MTRPPAAALAFLTVSGLTAEEPDLGGMARRFADEMIAVGTDRWGREQSPQFASMLLRTHPPELLPDAVFPTEGRPFQRMPVTNLPNIYKGNNRAHKITYRGGDAGSDGALFQLLYSLAAATGELRYADAADAALRWFLAHAPLHNGLLPWGEHSGWDFRRERADYGYPFDRKHEFDSRWPLWDRFLALQPVAVPGKRTVLERFSRGLWRGAVASDGDGLRYGRHAPMFEFDRPESGDWAQFGMFPRHGGYYLDLWSAALAATQSAGFAEWMLPRVEQFVTALERQTDEHGFAVYLSKQDVVFNSRQVASLAVDLQASAQRLERRFPELARRMSQLASRQDAAVIEAEGQVNPEDALRRAESNPEAAPEYRRLFFNEADRYLQAIGPREIGSNVGSATQPGRIPEQYALAINVLLLAHDLSDRDRAALYLAAAWERAREAVAYFLPDDSPLPRCLDRDPVLMDGSPFPSFYSSYLGGDDLMWSLWRLSAAGDTVAVR